MVLGAKRTWITEKEMDEFNHITGDQIRTMKDVCKLKKLERYMREEGFPQTAEAAYETIVKLGGRVVRLGEPASELDECDDEEFDGFLKNFDVWKDNIKDADDKLRQLQRAKANKATELGDNGKTQSIRSGNTESCTKKETAPNKDMRSGREYYERWDKFAAKCEQDTDEPSVKRGEEVPVNKKKERNAVKLKSQTEREWLANREREKGNELFKAKEYIASLDAYNLSIELFPKSAVTYANRAAVQLKLNRWDDAHADSSKALEIDPKFVKSLLRRGVANLEMDNPELALKDLTAAFELDPSCKEVTNLKQKAERAIETREQSGSKKIPVEEINSKEDTQTSSSALMDLETEENMEEKMMQVRIEKSMQKDRENSNVRARIEEVTSGTRENTTVSYGSEEYIPMRKGPMIIEEIVEQEETSRGTDEAQAERERVLGNEHVKCRDYCAAIKCYNKSLSLNPDVAATYANRALCYLKMRDWNTAKSDCTQAINLDTSYAKAYYRRALSSEGLGQLRDALRDLQVAHKLLPDDAEISDKLKCIKRKSRVAFVKEVSREGEKKLEEACQSPSMHDIKTQIGIDKENNYSNTSIGNDIGQQKETTSERSEFKGVSSNTNIDNSIRKKALPSKPRTAIEFQRCCEKLQDAPELLRKFINRIHVDEYPGIFKENLSPEVMRTILRCLQVAFMPHDPAGTMAILGGLVKVKRFALILKLMAPSEKNTFLSIFDWLRDACGAPLDRAQELKAQFY